MSPTTREASSASRWRWAWRCAWRCFRLWPAICLTGDNMQPLSPDQRSPSRVKAFVNARLIDPSSRLDQTGGVLTGQELIADLGPHIAAGAVGDAEIVDCGGRVLSPGLVDMMVFTGEPGHEHRETLATASRAAAAGGVTTIVCMPNTDPVIDDVALVDFILRRARDTALVNVHPLAPT